MHETILHKQLPIWCLASATCMLIYLLNISFMFSCTDNQFYFHLVSPCIHYHITLARTLPSLRQHCTIWGRKALPSSPEMWISTQHCSPGLFCVFLRESDSWPKKLRNAVCELAVPPSSNCALRNPRCQQPVWIVHCASPVSSISSQITQTTFCSVLEASHPTSQKKLCNLAYQFPKYVLCHSLNFHWFLQTYFLPCMLLVSRYFRCSSISQ